MENGSHEDGAGRPLKPIGGAVRKDEITTSCRKFDTFGDGYVVKNIGFAYCPRH